MWRRMPATVSFLLALLLTDVGLALLSERNRLAIGHATSTNVTHLVVDPLLVLPASAIVDLGADWKWLLLALVLLGGLERRLGTRGVVVVCLSAHVIATLLSEGLVFFRVAWHALPSSQFDDLDVGPSYVVLAGAAGCLVVGGWRLRAIAALAGTLIVPGLLAGLSHLAMPAVGHVASVAFGAVFAGRYLATARPARVAPHTSGSNGPGGRIASLDVAAVDSLPAEQARQAHAGRMAGVARLARSLSASTRGVGK